MGNPELIDPDYIPRPKLGIAPYKACRMILGLTVLAISLSAIVMAVIWLCEAAWRMI